MSEPIDLQHIYEEVITTWAELQLLKDQVKKNEPLSLDRIEAMIEHEWRLAVLFRGSE